MTANGSWSDRVADAAKDALLGVEAAAIIASSPAGILQDNHVQFTDPVTNSAMTALADGHEALSSAVEARAKAEEIAESTDVSQEQTSSLIVDPPSWLSSPNGFEAAINDDLANAWGSDEGGVPDGGDLGAGFF